LEDEEEREETARRGWTSKTLVMNNFISTWER